MVNQWTNYILSWLFHPSCPLCDTPLASGELLCGPCQSVIPTCPHPCPRCGLPLPAAVTEKIDCGHCQDQPPIYDQLIAACQYAPPLTELIAAFKFRQQLHYVHLFAHLLQIAVQAVGRTLPEVILPVPLHPSRQRQRGYNQALEIARLLGKQLSLPVDYKSVIRQRATAAQSNLDANSRSKNVRGAFTLAHSLPYRHIALLDDVVTTGNTVNEIARVIKQTGAVQVDIWCLARVAE